MPTMQLLRYGCPMFAMRLEPLIEDLQPCFRVISQTTPPLRCLCPKLLTGPFTVKVARRLIQVCSTCTRHVALSTLIESHCPVIVINQSTTNPTPKQLSHSSDTSVPLLALYLRTAEKVAWRKYDVLKADVDQIPVFVRVLMLVTTVCNIID